MLTIADLKNNGKVFDNQSIYSFQIISSIWKFSIREVIIFELSIAFSLRFLRILILLRVETKSMLHFQSLG